MRQRTIATILSNRQISTENAKNNDIEQSQLRRTYHEPIKPLVCMSDPIDALQSDIHISKYNFPINCYCLFNSNPSRSPS